MVWYRYARIRAIWRCYNARGSSTNYHVVGVALKDEYEKKPTEDIDVWVRRLGEFAANKMCENSCQSLSVSVFCDKTSVQVEVIYTSEVLVAEKKPVPPVPPVPKPKVPGYVLELIKFLEMKKEETKSKKGKEATQKEIDKLKKRYGIT